MGSAAQNLRALFLTTVTALVMTTSPALASCVSPAGNPGDIGYSSTQNIMTYCNGTNWINMGVSQPVSFGTLTASDFCTATSASAIACTTAGISLGAQVTGVLPAANGGTGVNNNSSTITLGGNLTTSGAFPLTFTTTGATSVTLPTTGTLVNTTVTTLSSLVSIGTITTGVWNGTVIGPTYGGTGLASYNKGDILYGSASNVLSALPIGTSGYILTASAGGVPVWSAAPATGVTSFSAGTTGLTPVSATTGAITLAGTLGVANGGTGLATLTSNVIYKGNGTGALAVSGLTDNGTIVSSSESIDATGKSYITEIADGSVATVLNTLAKLDASGNATKALVSDTDGIVGIVVGGAGTTGTTAQIAIDGQATCLFDGTAVVGHFVTISSTTAGDCHDAGATRSTTSQTIGRVLTGGTTATVALALNGAGGGAAAGATTNVQYNNGGAFAGDASFTYTTPGVVGIGTAAGSTGVLKMSGTTSGTVSIQPAAVAGTYNFILPASAGTAGQPLLSNAGSSAMAFGTLNYAGGGTGTTTQFTTGSVVFTGASGIYTQNNAQFFWDNTNFRLGIGTATPTQGLTVFGNIDAGGTNGYLTEIANAGTTGTTVNKLAKLNTSGAAVISAITDIDGMLGIVVGETAGGTSAVTTGNAQIATSGQASCIFDGQTVAGDYVSISATVAGDCLDGGTSRPLTNQTIGRVLTVNSGVGTAATVAISLSGSGQGGVPTGTIMAFAGTCPAGWTEYTAARGRFLRGIDNGAGNDPSGTRAAGATQADALQEMTGSVKVAGLTGGMDTPTGVFTINPLTNGTYPAGASSGAGGYAAFDASLQARTSTETRPKNVAVTFCQYTGGSPVTTTASGTANYVARWTSATTIGTGTMYDSGSAVGLNTASPQNLLDVNGAASIGYNVAAPTNGLIVSGNVGIGTTSPWASLVVTQSSDVSPSLTHQASSAFSLSRIGGVDLAFGINDATPITWIQARNNAAYGFYYNLALNPSGGNVGIGTTSPGALLSDAGAGAFVDGGGSTGTNGSGIQWSTGGAGYIEGLYNSSSAATADGLLVKITGTASTNRILTLNNSGGGGDVFVVQGNGNVGIGTTAPGALLHSYLSASTAGSTEVARFEDAGRYLSIYGTGDGTGGGDAAVGFGKSTGAPYAFYSSAGHAAANRLMTIMDSGNVGIGTTGPTKLLQTYNGEIDIDMPNTASQYSPLDFTQAGTRHALISYGHTEKNLYIEAVDSGSTMSLWTNNAQAMTINSSGNVGIGNSSPGVKLEVAGAIYADGLGGTSDNQTNAPIGTRNNTNTGNAFEWGHSNQSGYGNVLGFTNGGGQPFICFDCEAGSTNNTYRTRGQVGTIIQGDLAGGLTIGKIATATADNQAETVSLTLTGGGNLTITGAYSPSDIRLKKDVVEINNSLDKLTLLRGVTFRWKDPSKPQGEQIGVIAQDVKEVFPQLVLSDPSGTLSVNYAGLVAPLIEAVKELKADNNNLRAANDNEAVQIKALTARLDALENARR